VDGTFWGVGDCIHALGLISLAPSIQKKHPQTHQHFGEIHPWLTEEKKAWSSDQAHEIKIPCS
jgi:hypothetical protein